MMVELDENPMFNSIHLQDNTKSQPAEEKADKQETQIILLVAMAEK